MNAAASASPPLTAAPAGVAPWADDTPARRARLLDLIVHMEDTAAALMDGFAAQAHAEMAAAQAARDAAPIAELVAQGAGVRSGMAFDRMARVLRLAIMLEERVAEGTAGWTAPVRALPALPRAVPPEVAERLDGIDAPEQIAANERIDRLENEALRGDQPVEWYLAELFGEMERELRACGMNDAQVEAQMTVVRRKLTEVARADSETAAAAVPRAPDRGDAAPEGAAVRDPPNRGPP